MNIEVTFQSDQRVVKTRKYTQYDYGQQLVINGLSLPETLWAYFSTQRSGGTAWREMATTVDEITTVKIPDEAFENDDILWDYNIYVYLFVCTEDAGRTEHVVIIPVEARSGSDEQLSPKRHEQLEDKVEELEEEVRSLTREKADKTELDTLVSSKTVNGSSIVIEDSASAPFVSVKLFGKTEQVTTKGKQLFDGSSIQSNLCSSIDSEDMITIECDNSDSTSNAYVTFYTPVSELLAESTTYALVAEVFSTSGLGEKLYLASNSSNEFSQFEDSVSISDLTVGTHIILAKTLESFDASNFMCRGFMTIPAGTYVKSSIRFSVLADTAITADTFEYEKFTEGKPSPSPEYPQELESVGDSGINIFVHGKNQLCVDCKDYVVNDMYITFEGNGMITLEGICPMGYAVIKQYQGYGFFQKGKSYYIDSVCENFHLGFWFRSSDGSLIDTLSTESVKTIIIPDNVAMVEMFYAGVATNVQVKLTEQFMLHLGDEPSTVFESFGQMLTLINRLGGIPVSSGGNYTDENGQQWVCDEIDFERGVYIQRTILLSTPTLNKTETSTKQLKFTTSFGLADRSVGLCSVTDTMVYSASIDSVHYYITTNNVYVHVPVDYDYETNPVQVVCALETPIETELSAGEIQAYKALHANNPNTTVSNDCNAYMSAEYITKMYDGLARMLLARIT